MSEMGAGFGKVENNIWGYKTPSIEPYDIVEKLKEETTRGLEQFQVLPEGPDPCRDRPGYCRVSVNIPLSQELYDQFMNGSSGYRGQYFLGIENGEAFNRLLVVSIAPIIVNAVSLYKDMFDPDLCKKSLCGSFSKFWFSKEITDPSGQDYLCGLPEVIRVERWKDYWKYRVKPWKGLLAPKPENRCVLLNGTFIDPSTGEVYEQKPTRSQQLYESGWT